MTAVTFVQCVLNGLMSGMIYVLIALGLTLVFGIMHIVNFAHGEVYMLGAFAIWWLSGSIGLNFGLSFIVSLGMLFVFGLLLEKVLFSRFPGRGGLLPSLIICLGLVAILPNVVSLIFGPYTIKVPTIIKGSQHVGQLFVSNERLLVIGAGAVLLVALILFISRTKIGNAMRASEQDPDAAMLQGVSMSQVRLVCMGLGCLLAAAAAGLVSPIFSASPWMAGPVIMKSFIIIIIGGMGSIPGAVLGGLILGFFESFGIAFLNPDVVVLLAFLLVMGLLLIKPTGLLGHA